MDVLEGPDLSGVDHALELHHRKLVARVEGDHELDPMLLRQTENRIGLV